MFSPDPISGDLNGVDYTIEVVAKLLNEDGEEEGSDSASYTLKVFSPVTKYTASKHTNTSGYVVLTRLYYEDPNVFSDGYIYLANQTREADGNAETYFYEWGGRLVITTSNGTDTKCTGSGSLETGEYLYIPCIPLSLNADSKYARRGEIHTVKATYWINVNTGVDAETDHCQLERTYRFLHPK